MHRLFKFLRTIIQCAIVLIALILIFRTWVVEGFFLPRKITDGSMARTLSGPHFQVECPDCRFPFSVEYDRRRPAATAECPNCGRLQINLARFEHVAGDGILIHRQAFRFRDPKRWEVVVFQNPLDARRTAIRRVVGLPGEKIRIHEGNVWINGSIARKNLQEQRQIGLLVHDTNYPREAVPGLPKRWIVEGQWMSNGRRFSYPAESGHEDWLAYRHGRRDPENGDQLIPEPIGSAYSYNTHSQQANERHSDVELSLSIHLIEIFGRGELLLEIDSADDTLRVELSPLNNRFQFFQNGELLEGGEGELPSLDSSTVEFSVIDRQVLLAVDGVELAAVPYEEADFAKTKLTDKESVKADKKSKMPEASPVRIASRQLGVILEDLRIYRDLYYPPAEGHVGERVADERRLAGDEYFVLGDNPAISDDSRLWGLDAGVHDYLFMGKPILVHFPPRKIRVGNFKIQVPDLTKIRYIQ